MDATDILIPVAGIGFAVGNLEVVQYEASRTKDACNVAKGNTSPLFALSCDGGGVMLTVG